MNRNLSGIFMPGKDQTCFEEWPENKQDTYLNSLDKEELIALAKNLGKSIKKIGEFFDLTKEEMEE